MLVQETKNRGYRFGNASDPSYGCWGYSCRAIAGSSNASNHSWGLAVDINAPTNPYTTPLKTDMPRWMPQLWESYGFRWGGNYSGRKDAMHYEFMGSVSEAATQTAKARANGLGGDKPTPPVPPTEPDKPQPPVVIQEDDDMAMQLLKIKGGDGKIYAASVVGKRFFYVDNPDNLSSNQKAGTYSQDIKELDSGQMNHVRWSCTIQQELPNETPIP
jgi:hypothetical protein